MAAPRYLPSDKDLAKFVRQGMTHQEIADHIEKQTGHRVARASVSSALSRAGLTNRVRYEETIPWERIKIQHNHHYALQMLRLLARRNAGETLSEDKENRLNSWIEKLQQANAVTVYLPDSDDGFYYVKRKSGDDPSSFIRFP